MGQTYRGGKSGCKMEAQLDLATVRYHALGAYAKSVYLVGDLLREKNQGR